MKFKSEEMRTAYERAGWRERYAMEHGKRRTYYQHGHKLHRWTYDAEREYQDANGATYDATRREWIG